MLREFVTEMSWLALSVTTSSDFEDPQMQRIRAGHAAFRFAALALALLTGLSECLALWRARLRLHLLAR